MPTEPSPGELLRMYQQLREDTRRGFESVNERLDKMPTSELFMAHLSAWQRQLDNTDSKVEALRRHVDTELTERDAQRQRDEDRRRWLIGAVALPILLSLLALAAATGVIG